MQHIVDDRRHLIEWGEGFQSVVSKALIAKHGCVVGDHYHQKKDENFLLLSGRASKIVIGETELKNIEAPQEFKIPANTYHRFELDEGSVLLGTATAAFDREDEIKGKP